LTLLRDIKARDVCTFSYQTNRIFFAHTQLRHQLCTFFRCYIIITSMLAFTQHSLHIAVLSSE